MSLLLIVVAVVGLLTGSFLDVVIRRVPHGLPVLSPAPHRRASERLIRAHSTRPVLELGTGAVFVAVTWRAVQLGQSAALPALLVFSALGIALAAIDLAVRRLPDKLVLPAYPVLAVLLALAGAVRHDWESVARAGLGGVALFAFFLALATVHRDGMGFGDVKLAGVVGLVLGYLSWSALLVGAFAAFLLGAVVGVVVIVSGHGGRRTALPFGPFLVVGALSALWVAAPAAGLLML